MEALKSHMDEGVYIEDSGVDTEICLNFAKLNLPEFSLNKNTGKTANLFLTIAEHQVENSLIEHPLTQAYLFKKFKQVKWIFYFLMVSHFVFSVVFSIYCGLLFSFSCRPDPKETENERKVIFTTIDCEMEKLTPSISSLIIFCWLFNFFGVIMYFLRELFRFISDKSEYFMKLESWRNIFIIISVVMLGHNGHEVLKDDFKLKLFRWQYHLAAISSLVIWFEMMHLVGRLPMFGKYVQMFRSVSWTLLRFFFPFVFIVIGFMMSFMILFSYQEPFQEVTSAFVKVCYIEILNQFAL